MEKIFCKKFLLYKILEPDELSLIFQDKEDKFSAIHNKDYRIFTNEEEVIKQANEYKIANNLNAIFYAQFETDGDYYNEIAQKCDSNNYVLFSKEQLPVLNSHILITPRGSTMSFYQVFEYKESLLNISLWTVFDLHKLGVTFDEQYFEYVCSHQRPYKRKGRLLFLADSVNKELREELGRIVVYKEEPVFYEDVESAVFDNYEERYKFGFENLHKYGIVPAQAVSKSVSKFGVTIKEKTRHREDPRITNLNDVIEKLYQWKYNKKALNCYNDPFFRDQDDGQTLEEFKEKEVRYRCFMALADMNFILSFKQPKKRKKEPNTQEAYFQGIEKLLNRYKHNESSVFQMVDDLNDYVNIPGIYVLCFDFERKLYIGQTRKCLKERILQHFTTPQSTFDRTHSLNGVTSIYILNVSEAYLDFVEADCIASLDPTLLFNIYAGGQSIEMISSKDYDPNRYLLEDKAISLISEETNSLNSVINEFKKEKQ